MQKKCDEIQHIFIIKESLLPTNRRECLQSYKEGILKLHKRDEKCSKTTLKYLWINLMKDEHDLHTENCTNIVERD